MEPILWTFKIIIYQLEKTKENLDFVDNAHQSAIKTQTETPFLMTKDAF